MTSNHPTPQYSSKNRLIALLVLAGMIAVPVVWYLNFFMHAYDICSWGGRAQAWVDLNRNGQWDQDEPPLPNVDLQVLLPDRSVYDNVVQSMTNTGGIANITVQGNPQWRLGWLGCYGLRQIRAQALAPDGFQLNGQPSRQLIKDGGPSFAFVPTDTHVPLPLRPLGRGNGNVLPPATTEASAAERFPRLECHTADLPDDSIWFWLTNKIFDIEATPAGEVWLASEKGIAQFDPDSGTWRASYRLQDLDGGTPVDLHLAADNTVYATVESRRQRRIYALSETGWARYGPESGLPAGQINDTAVTQIGDIWYATQTGIALWQKRDSQLSFYSPAGDLVDGATAGPELLTVEQLPNGTVWFAAADFFSFVEMGDDGQQSWQTYPAPDTQISSPPEAIPSSTAVQTDEQGRVWFNIHLFYQPELNLWRETAVQQMNNRVEVTVEIDAVPFTVTPAGQLWFGTEEGQIVFVPDPLSEKWLSWLVYYPDESLIDSAITAIAHEANEALWISTEERLLRCTID